MRAPFVIVTGLSVLAVCLPLATSIYLADQRASDAERSHLAEYANWTLLRAQKNLDQAFETLALIEKEGWQACSAEHIARMRRMASDAGSVESFAYLRDGRVLCTGWGLTPGQPAVAPPGRQFDGGYDISVDTQALAPLSGKVLSITHGRHMAQLKPERLVDVLRDTSMSLGVALAAGPTIAVSGEIAPELVGQLTQAPVEGESDRNIYASVVSNGLAAFAVSERSDIGGRIERELWILVPIGLLMSALLVGMVYWVSRQRFSFPATIAAAVRRREFVPFYQPIISLQTGRCVGAEALVRWMQPDGSMVAPNAFIPVAEEAGLLGGMTDQVIERVAADMKAIIQASHDMHVAINVCAQDIETGRFLPVLDSALARHGVDARHIWIEVTERGFVHAQAACNTLSQVRARGHAVAIDDFGTGYSSLSLLEQLPLDALKIDKSFVDSIGKNAATSVVTQHIVEMAQGLELAIVAEGIETAEQEAYLRQAGVEYGQGWLYAKAMPFSAFICYLKEH